MAVESANVLLSLQALLTEIVSRERILETKINSLHRRLPIHPPYRTVFLVHNMGAWDSIADVFEAMNAAPDFEPIVCAIGKKMPTEVNVQGVVKTSERLTELGVPHLRIKQNNAERETQEILSLSPDILIRQGQWDGDISAGFSTERMNFIRTVYIPYELFSPVDAISCDPDVVDPTVDSDFHRQLWLQFVANENVVQWGSTRESAYFHEDLPRPSIVASGHPKAERLQREIEKFRRSKPKTEYKVLWQAHHAVGDNWSCFGMFSRVAHEMIQFAIDNSDIDVIFSAHPMLLDMMERGHPTLNKEYVRIFWESWNALPNTYVFDGGNYAELFSKVDVLISDGISWLLEFQIANKPVIFLEREDHIPFNILGERIAAGTYRCSGAPEGLARILEFKNGRNHDLLAKQKEIVDELMIKKGSVNLILQAIRDKALQERLSCNQ